MEQSTTDVNRKPQTPVALEATFLLEMDGHIRNPSDVLLRLLGYQSAADIAHLVDLIADPREVDQIANWIRSSVGSCAMQLQTNLLCVKGCPVPVELVAWALPNGDTLQAYCAVKVLALTEAHAIEGDLIASSKHIIDMWQNAPCGYHSLDAQGRILEVNQTELTWMGRPLEDVLHRPITDFYTAQSGNQFKQRFEQFIKDGHVEGLEYELVGRDGSIRHISLSATVVRDAHGVYQGTRSVLYDISELVQSRAQLSQMIASQEATLRELRASQAALVENEFRWKFAVEGAGEGVWDWNLATGETTFSPRWREIYGYTQDEALPSHTEIRSRIHPEDFDGAMASIEEFLASKTQAYSMEFRLQNKHGAYIWAQSRGAAVSRDSAGRPLRVIGTHRNIDSEVKSRRRLEQSEERMRAITDNSSSVMFLKDLNGRYLYINKTYETLFKVPRDTVYGKSDFDIFPAELAQRFVSNDQKVIATERILEMEEDAPQDDGIHTYLSVKVPVRDPQGNIYAVCGMATDITERKRMGHELRIAAVAFESPMCMMITDENQVIQQVNRAFVEVTGFTADYAVGRTPHFLRSGKHDAAFYADMWKSIRETGNWQGEIWGLRSNRELYLKWLSVSVVRDGAGQITHYVGTEKDISERKRTEAALEQLNRTLEQKKAQLRELVAKNEAVREKERKHIAREVHDELGQVLTALRMDTSFIAMRYGTLDPALSAKVLAMRALVDKAIQGVRNVASNLRPMALDMGIYLALDWLCQDFTKRTGVACLLDAKEKDVYLDESRSIVVFRIVQESLTNISRYAQASRVLVGLGTTADGLGVEIQDDGIGFDPVAVEANKTFGLLGMRERAFALGGRLDIVSAPGQGATIGLTIPVERRKDGAQR